jgi:hypothetical protein
MKSFAKISKGIFNCFFVVWWMNLIGWERKSHTLDWSELWVSRAKDCDAANKL